MFVGIVGYITGKWWCPNQNVLCQLQLHTVARTHLGAGQSVERHRTESQEKNFYGWGKLETQPI